MCRYIILFFGVIAASGCNGDNVDLYGNKLVKAEDFVKAFTDISTPCHYADTGLYNLGDTLPVSYAVLSQFIPDSVLEKCLGKTAAKFSISPVGKIEKEKKEKYLLVKFTKDKKIKLVSFVLSPDNKYLSYLELLSNEIADKYTHSVSVTAEPTFIINREKNLSGNILYTRNGFAFNEESHSFIAVVNDTNEDLVRANEIINPIDTLPRKSRYSGDYSLDPKNFIAIRDGKNESTRLFFFHFDKNNGGCAGELKAEMTIVSAGKAVYHENGDPCTINFTISNNAIHIKEDGNCGNYRGITCLIDYQYSKKKEKKVAVKKLSTK